MKRKSRNFKSLGTMMFTLIISMLFAANAFAATAAQEGVAYPTVKDVTESVTEVIVDFNQEMDPSTINKDTFIVKAVIPGVGYGTVAGDVEYEGTTATFTSYSNLLYGFNYTLTVTTGAEDTTGSFLETDYTEPFIITGGPIKKTGIFLPGPVEGLYYSSGTTSGYTDSSGTFIYEVGYPVIFKIGDILLGQAEGKPEMTAVELVTGTVDENNATVVNMLRFVQTLDDDSDVDNGILITDEVSSNASGVTVDFSDEDFEDTIQNVVNALDDDDSSLVTVADARSHFRLTLLNVPDSVVDKKVRQFIDSRVTTAKDIPGCAMVILTEDGNKWVKTTGVSDKENGTPMTSTAKFRIGSATKTFTAMTILQLAEEGKLSLDDTLKSKLPEVVPVEKYDTDVITIRMMLNHSSGIASFTKDNTCEGVNPCTEDKTWLNDLVRNKDVTKTPQELIEKAMEYNKYNEPEEGWKYSNTNYVLLGLIIEKITGNRWEDEVKDRFIDALGLTNTIVPEKSQSEMTGDYVHGYIDRSRALDEGIDGYYIDNSRIEPSLLWSSGCMIASMEDLVRWIQAVGSGELLNDEYQGMLETEYVEYSGEPNWGLGLLHVPKASMISHPGQLTGYDVGMSYQLENKYAIAVGINRQLYGKFVNMNVMFLYGMAGYLDGLNNNPSDPPPARSKKSMSVPLPYMW
ncbi:MAG: serine hydrolase [Desulfobacterales bacterium]|nr:serine hydrolase [Desulfobacterales bacterium]